MTDVELREYLYVGIDTITKLLCEIFFDLDRHKDIADDLEIYYVRILEETNSGSSIKNQELKIIFDYFISKYMYFRTIIKDVSNIGKYKFEKNYASFFAKSLMDRIDIILRTNSEKIDCEFIWLLFMGEEYTKVNLLNKYIKAGNGDNGSILPSYDELMKEYGENLGTNISGEHIFGMYHYKMEKEKDMSRRCPEKKKGLAGIASKKKYKEELEKYERYHKWACEIEPKLSKCLNVIGASREFFKIEGEAAIAVAGKGSPQNAIDRAMKMHMDYLSDLRNGCNKLYSDIIKFNKTYGDIPIYFEG